MKTNNDRHIPLHPPNAMNRSREPWCFVHIESQQRELLGEEKLATSAANPGRCTSPSECRGCTPISGAQETPGTMVSVYKVVTSAPTRHGAKHSTVNLRWQERIADYMRNHAPLDHLDSLCSKPQRDALNTAFLVAANGRCSSSPRTRCHHLISGEHGAMTSKLCALWNIGLSGETRAGQSRAREVLQWRPHQPVEVEK